MCHILVWVWVWVICNINNINMKTNILNSIIIYGIMMLITTTASAQVYCPPGPPSPVECSTCPGITVINQDPNITLNFYWEYNNGTCTQFAVAGSCGPNSSAYLPGFCLSF